MEISLDEATRQCDVRKMRTLSTLSFCKKEHLPHLQQNQTHFVVHLNPPPACSVILIRDSVSWPSIVEDSLRYPGGGFERVEVAVCDRENEFDWKGELEGR